MKTSTGRRLGALLVATLLLLAAACSDDDDTSATGGSNTTAGAVDCDFSGDEIKIGTQVAAGPLVGEQFLDFVPGVRARLEKENEENNGIDGRRFVIVEREAQLNPATVTQNATELVERENVSAILSADPAQPAAAQYLNEQDVPVFGFAINQVWGQFDNMTGYGGDTFPDIYAPPAPSSLFELAINDLGATKLASFGFVESQESMASAQNVATSWELSGGGSNSVYDVSFGATDLTGEAQQLKEDGVDAIAGSITRDSFIQLIVAARQAGVDLKFAQSPTGYEETTLEQNGDELAGVYIGSPFAPFELNREGHQEYLDAMAKYSPERPPKQMMGMVGYLTADLLIESIKAAGGCPSREAILDGMLAVEGYDGRGLLEPWDVGPGQGIPQLCGWVLKVSDDGTAFEPQFNGEAQCTAVEDFQR